MEKSNIIRLMKSFSKREMTRFKSFVFSPYINKHEGTRALLTHLMAHFPDFPAESIAEAALRAALGNGKPLSKAELSLRSTYLQRLALDFISKELTSQKVELNKASQLEALRYREQYKLYEKLERKFLQQTDRPTWDTDHYYAQYKLYAEADNYRNQRSKYDQPDLILNKQKMLNSFFLTEKMKDACELLQRAKVLKKENFPVLEDFAMQEVLDNLQNYVDVPPLMVYHAVYQMLRSDTERSFQKAEGQLKIFHDALATSDLVNVYNFLLNFCIQRVNEGLREWLPRSFELYKGMLVNDLLQVDNVLPEWHYKNLATNGLLLGETDWVFDFIHQYKADLNPDIAENAFAYNLAALYYQLGTYDKVLPLLLKVEYTEWRYAINAKVLLLKTYYEMEASEALLALHDSFRQFIQRHKQLNDFRRRSYYNLLRYTINAFKVKMDASYSSISKQQKEYQKLKEKFDGCAHCFNRSWVSEKIEELKINWSHI